MIFHDGTSKKSRWAAALAPSRLRAGAPGLVNNPAGYQAGPREKRGFPTETRVFRRF
jgi:hypothetical protein